MDGTLQFGYFHADEKNPGRNLPGQTVFTCLSHDIVVHEATHALVHETALARSGSYLVPAPLGSIDGAWKDPDVEGARAEGPLAFASEFLPGTQDAWRVALDSARRSEDFTDRARALGEATAQIHVSLASVKLTVDGTAVGTITSAPFTVPASIRM